MLTVFFGTDTIRVRGKAFELLHALEDKGALITMVTPESYQSGMIAELTQGSSLFDASQAVVLDMLSEGGEEVFGEVIDSLPSMQTSKNHFIMIEGPLLAPAKKALQMCGAKLEELTAEKKEKFNAFSMTDALLRRDKKSLWILLMEAWKQGLSNEEIIGVLFWQLKTLRLVEKTKSAEEAGQKPFVYQKARRALSNFKKGELDTLSGSLVSVYHDGHMGKVDTGLALEKWVLTL